MLESTGLSLLRIFMPAQQRLDVNSEREESDVLQIQRRLSVVVNNYTVKKALGKQNRYPS